MYIPVYVVQIVHVCGYELSAYTVHIHSHVYTCTCIYVHVHVHVVCNLKMAFISDQLLANISAKQG